MSIEVYFILLIIAIPIYFLWKNWLQKIFPHNRTRKIAAAIASIISSFVVYIGLISFWFLIASYYPNRKFDKESWLNNMDTRYEISRDLIQSHVLIGKSKSEVREFLGDEGNKDEHDRWRYCIGYKPSIINIDPSNISIEFKDGRVIDVMDK